MQQRSYSLKKRLIWFTGIFSVVLGCILMVSSYKVALQEINEILDKQMHFQAERVAAQELRHQQSNFDPNRKYSEEDLFVDIWSYRELAHQQHPNQVLIPVKVPQAGFYEHESWSGTWLAYVIPLQDYQVQVSQQQSVREMLAWELAASLFIPYMLIIPLALWGLIHIIQRSLKPLDDFKAELAQRNSDDLTPIQDLEYPAELLPTIKEMNHLLQRISIAQQEQKQFIADAAHELRTPITALNLQTQILQKQFPDQPEIKNLSKGLVRMQHLVSQLLTLAKQDAFLVELEQPQDFELNQVALSCVEELMHLAMQKEQDLGLLRNETVRMHSQPTAVHSIIFNLLDNAIKYTPAGGVINLSIYQQDDDAYILLEDSGPGISPELYEQVMKRFYRIHHHLEQGSGLGMSIVHKAIQRLGGSIQMDRSTELSGLWVLVRLPTHWVQKKTSVKQRIGS